MEGSELEAVGAILQATMRARTLLLYTVLDEPATKKKGETVVAGLVRLFGGLGLSRFLGKACIGRTLSRTPTAPVLENISILKEFFFQDWLVYLSHLVFYRVVFREEDAHRYEFERG